MQRSLHSSPCCSTEPSNSEIESILASYRAVRICDRSECEEEVEWHISEHGCGQALLCKGCADEYANWFRERLNAHGMYFCESCKFIFISYDAIFQYWPV